jgi:hypothetical protein
MSLKQQDKEQGYIIIAELGLIAGFLHSILVNQ